MTDWKHDTGGGDRARDTLAHAPHGHGGAHPPAEEDRISSRSIVYVGVAALLIFLAASLATAYAMRRQQRGLEPDGPRALPAELGQAKIGLLEQRLFENANQAEVMSQVQRRKLGSAAWVDRGQGVIRIPIDRAMELVLQGERPAPVAPPAPGAAPAQGAGRGMGDAPGAQGKEARR